MDKKIYHHGVKGMKWGVRRYQPYQTGKGPKGEFKDVSKKTQTPASSTNTKNDPMVSLGNRAKKAAYSVGVRLAPREMKYGVQRLLNNPNASDKELAKAAVDLSKVNGVLPNSAKLMDSIEKVGIEKHKAAKYDLDNTDLDRLKTYTDAAWYSRSVNAYLATGEPAEFKDRANELKDTIRKNTVSNTTVYRSTSMQFSFDGIAKKLETMSEKELADNFDSFSKNYKGKTFKENRVFSTSTSPNFAIDTWRKVNPNAAANYNTYMIINTVNTPGILADGKTNSGKRIVNTKSNQEGILAPSKMRYESLSYDQERGMFAITVTAMGEED